MANKPTTLSYFIKRLRDCGYEVREVFSEYAEIDPRVWTVLIDPGTASIWCTLWENRYEPGDKYFEFYDGGQFLPVNQKIRTSSIEVLVDMLVQHGINHKHPDYPRPAEPMATT